jgi:hypothetical protein
MEFSRIRVGSSFHVPRSSFGRAVSPPALPVFEEVLMNNIIYIVGLIVVVLAILSFIGLG